MQLPSHLEILRSFILILSNQILSHMTKVSAGVRRKAGTGFGAPRASAVLSISQARSILKQSAKRETSQQYCRRPAAPLHSPQSFLAPLYSV